MPSGLRKKWHSRYTEYQKAHKGSTCMSFFSFVTHMERTEKAALLAQQMQRDQEEAEEIRNRAQKIVDKQNSKKQKKKPEVQTQQSGPSASPVLDLGAQLGDILKSALSGVMSRLEQIESKQKSTAEAGIGMGSHNFPPGGYLSGSVLGMYPVPPYLNPLSQHPSLQEGPQQGGGGTPSGQATTSHSQASGVPLGGVTLIRSHPSIRHQDSHGKGGGGADGTSQEAPMPSHGSKTRIHRPAVTSLPSTGSSGRQNTTVRMFNRNWGHS